MTLGILHHFRGHEALRRRPWSEGTWDQRGWDVLLLGRHRGVGRVWSQTAVTPPALSGQATDVSCASVSLLIKSDGGGGVIPYSGFLGEQNKLPYFKLLPRCVAHSSHMWVLAMIITQKWSSRKVNDVHGLQMFAFVVSRILWPWSQGEKKARKAKPFRPEILFFLKASLGQRLAIPISQGLLRWHAPRK